MSDLRSLHAGLMRTPMILLTRESQRFIGQFDSDETEHILRNNHGNAIVIVYDIAHGLLKRRKPVDPLERLHNENFQFYLFI